jgi:thiol-disulfide isomerase/thioredoxin
VDGREIKLSAFKGRLVVLSFWATWCSPCLEELPRLERFHRVYGENALEVVAINFGEDRKRVRKFLKKNPALTLQVVLDPRKLASKQLGVKGIPTTIVLDRTGAVRWVRVGYDDKYQEELISQLNQLVAEPGDSSSALPPVPPQPAAGP